LPDRRRWALAKELRVGSMLQTSAGSWVQVTAVRAWSAQKRVHNLTVDGLHTYYVLVGGGAVLSHNEDPACEVTEYGPFHRRESPTQTVEDVQIQVESQEMWGKGSRHGSPPMVKAWDGPLPEGRRGVEFYTQVPPSGTGLPWVPEWRGPRPGVRIEGDFAKIAVRTTKNTQT
jgi:hypothetical protein